MTVAHPQKKTYRELIPYDEAARELAVGRTSVRRMVADGRLQAVRLGPRTVRVTRASLDALLGR